MLDLLKSININTDYELDLNTIKGLNYHINETCKNKKSQKFKNYDLISSLKFNKS